MPKISRFGPRVLGWHEYQRQQKLKRMAANLYGPRVRGPIDADEAEAPVRRIRQEPKREPHPENADGRVDEAEAAGQEPAEGPPEEAEGEPADDPDAELRRAVVAFVREHPGASEALVRRTVRGSTRRIRRAVRELLADGELEDLGGARGKRLHVKDAP